MVRRRRGHRAQARPGASAAAGGFRPRWPRRALPRALIAAVALLVAVIASAVAFVPWPDGSSSPPRAAIVDQLALTNPNPDFVAGVTADLTAAGYAVDYVPSQDVTVDYYRSLPDKGYKLIILRSHVAEQIKQDPAGGAYESLGDAALFTGELYDPASPTNGVSKQHRSAVIGVGWNPDVPDSPHLFTVLPAFITSEARGRFGGTTIVLMGCAGLKTDKMARAFVEKGAGEFISWDTQVSADHTDKATITLLRHLVGERLPAADAVAKTMDEVGADPSFGARLAYFP